MTYDVIVIGSGIAGLMAAIEAKSETNSVAIITKSNIFKSNSAVASGGINAVLDENDEAEIQKHCDDTMKSSKDLGDKKAISYLCHQAPLIIKKLVEYGVEFDRDEYGKILQRSFGGGSSKRTCFVGDSTGSAITQVLIKKAKLKREALTLHTANSFATLTVPESHLDMVRAGGVIYGDSLPDRVEYKKLMTFKTQVATVNAYLKGTTVGYDQTYTLKRDSLLANLPLGYSDGYRRAFSNKAYVLIRGHKVPVVGRTSMNTTMVDVTDFPDIRANDEVVLFGEQGGATVKQSDLEEYNGALLADVYTMWGNSNPKVVVK